MRFKVYYATQVNYLAVSCQYKREPPSPRLIPWKHTSLQGSCGTDPLTIVFCAAIHTLTHILTVDRTMVVGHVPTAHKCSFMCI